MKKGKVGVVQTPTKTNIVNDDYNADGYKSFDNTEQDKTYYEVLDWKVFKAFVKDDVLTRHEIDGEIVYEINDPDMINRCIDAGAIRIRIDGGMIRMKSPEELIARITNVEREIWDDSSTYKVYTTRGMMKFQTSEMSKVSCWKNKMFEMKMSIGFPGTSKKNDIGDLRDVIDYVGSIAVVTEEELVSEDMMLGEKIMNRIRRMVTVVDYEDHKDMDNILEEDECYVLSSTTVLNAATDVGVHASPKEIGQMLKTFKAKPNRQKRRGNIRRSEWYFTPWKV